MIDQKRARLIAVVIVLGFALWLIGPVLMHLRRETEGQETAKQNHGYPTAESYGPYIADLKQDLIRRVGEVIVIAGVAWFAASAVGRRL